MKKIAIIGAGISGLFIANLFKENQDMPDSDLKLEDICNKLILFGSADEVADKIMELQSGISYELNQEKIGKTYKVLFDKVEGDYFIGRTEFDSPEVDNEVLVKKENTYIRLGDFTNVKITNADHYDLYGEVID